MNEYWNEEKAETGLETINFPNQPGVPPYLDPQETIYEKTLGALKYIWAILWTLFLGAIGITLASCVLIYLPLVFYAAWKIAWDYGLPWIESW